MKSFFSYDICIAIIIIIHNSLLCSLIYKMPEIGICISESLWYFYFWPMYLHFELPFNIAIAFSASFSVIPIKESVRTA